MPTGFIYIVNTVTPAYQQPDFSCVPTVWKDRLYFAACKVPMRPKMRPGDWIFGVSPSNGKPRRIVFAAEVAEAITFAEAYQRYPALRGPEGPNPVRPVEPPRARVPWPRSHYEPVRNSSHEGRWDRDLARPDLDRFFVCSPPAGWRNRWMGAEGPVVDEPILGFFNRCMVFGQSASGTSRNAGTPTAPIANGRMYRGLHLETPRPHELLALCEKRVPESFAPNPGSPGGASPSNDGRGCGTPAVKRRASRRC